MIWSSTGIVTHLCLTCCVHRALATQQKANARLRELTNQLGSSPSRQSIAKIADTVELCARTTPNSFPPGEVQALALAFAKSAYPEGCLRVLTASYRSGTKLKPFAYESVAYHLAHSRAWDQIPPLVALALHQTLRVTRRLLNIRIQSLVELKHFAFLESALDDFQRRKVSPNPNTYHLLMKGHIMNNNIPKAQESIDWMIEAGFPISSETQAAMISIFSKTIGHSTKIEHLALDVLSDAVSATEATEAVVLNSLMRARLAARDVEGMFRYLSMFNISSKDLRFFPAGMACRNTFSRRTSPNADTYRTLLRFFLDGRDLDRFDMAMEALLEKGIPFDTSFVASMIRAASISGNLPRAIGIVKFLCRSKPGAASFLAQVMGSLCDLPKQVKLKLLPLEPDKHIFNVLLEVWLAKEGLRHIIPFFHAMEIAVNGPDHNTIGILARHMRRYKGVRPPHILRFLCNYSRLWPISFSNSIYEIVLAIALRDEIGRSNSRALKKLQQRNQLSSLMLAYREQAREFSWQAVNLLRLPPPEKRYLILLLRSLNERQIRQSPAGLALKIRYQAVIRRDLRAAENTLTLMRSQGMEVNHFHYASLVEGYVASGQMEAAQRIAQHFGQQPNAAVLYTIIIHSYARSRQPHKAQFVFDEMMRQKIMPDWAAIDALVGAWSKSGLFDIAKQTLLRLWPLVSEMTPTSDPGLTFSALLREFRQSRCQHKPHEVEPKSVNARFGIATQRKFSHILLRIALSRKRRIV